MNLASWVNFSNPLQFDELPVSRILFHSTPKLCKGQGTFEGVKDVPNLIKYSFLHNVSQNYTKQPNNDDKHERNTTTATFVDVALQQFLHVHLVKPIILQPKCQPKTTPIQIVESRITSVFLSLNSILLLNVKIYSSSSQQA